MQVIYSNCWKLKQMTEVKSYYFSSSLKKESRLLFKSCLVMWKAIKFYRNGRLNPSLPSEIIKMIVRINRSYFILFLILNSRNNNLICNICLVKIIIISHSNKNIQSNRFFSIYHQHWSSEKSGKKEKGFLLPANLVNFWVSWLKNESILFLS